MKLTAPKFMYFPLLIYFLFASVKVISPVERQIIALIIFRNKIVHSFERLLDKMSVNL